MRDLPAPVGASPLTVDLLIRLRDETRILHGRMEASFPLPADFDRGAYEWLLTRLFSFVEPWERHAGPVLNRVLPGFFPPRQKSHHLVADLSHFGHSISQLNAIPRCSRLPGLESPAQCLGALYVFEGATLGGQILTRNLARQLNTPDGSGYSYFRGYGPETARMWRLFGETVRDYAAGGNGDQVVSSAVMTFECLESWLAARRPGP